MQPASLTFHPTFYISLCEMISRHRSDVSDEAAFHEALDNDTSSINAGISENEDSDSTIEHTDEVSLLEYARSHGLCTDYTLVDIMASDTLGDLPLATFIDGDHFPDPPLPPDLCGNEKLCLDRNSVLLLREMLCTDDICYTGIASTYERKRGYKADSPVLSTDSELDLRRFTEKPKSCNAVNIAELPSIEQDTDLDEQLPWLDTNLPLTVNKRASSEKLHMTARDTSFLQAVCEDKSTGGEEEFVIEKVSENSHVHTAVLILAVQSC